MEKQTSTTQVVLEKLQTEEKNLKIKQKSLTYLINFIFHSFIFWDVLHTIL